jgi:glycosyltransferase involved in cell wall biosynthesis
MKIGIDLRALQTGHKYRGIGEVAKQTTDRILALASDDKRHDIEFVFYEYDDDDPKDLLTLPAGLKYGIVKLGAMVEANDTEATRDKMRRKIAQLYGSPIPDTRQCDTFLQFDYAFGVPRDTKTILIKHDLIPYVFWDKYFESAWVPFKNKALRTTLRTLFANKSYMRILRRSLKDAHLILAVSDSTKKDVERFFNIKPKKVKTALLGVDVNPAKTTNDNQVSQSQLPTKPYLLFVGAGDPRRRVEDAIAVFNNLKADGASIQLVLVGENFQSLESIPNPVVRDAAVHSSYSNDILALGYVDDETKQDLYKNALAFVYPTRYEGFGIPVLEAMLLECPIVTYKNSSLPEVGGEHAYYASNWMEMKEQVEAIMALPNNENAARKKAAKLFAEQFTWDKTAKIIYEELISAADK